MADHKLGDRVRVIRGTWQGEEGTITEEPSMLFADDPGPRVRVEIMVPRSTNNFTPLAADVEAAPSSSATLMAALIEQELELAHSGDGYEPKAVAEEIVKDHVAPALEAKDAEIERLRTQLRNDVATARTLVSRLVDATTGTWFGWEDPHHDPLIVADQAVGIARERLVRINELRAELEAERAESDAIRDALDGLILDVDCEQPDGTTPSADMSLPDYIAAMRAELEALRKTAGTTRYHQSRHAEAYRELVKARAERDVARSESTELHQAAQQHAAELEALKANAVALPEHWRQHLSGAIKQCRGAMHPLDSAVTAVHLMIESWLGQPDTEATEQAGRLDFLRAAIAAATERGELPCPYGSNQCTTVDGHWYHGDCSRQPVTPATPTCPQHGVHPHNGHECDECVECTQGPATPTEPRVWPEGVLELEPVDKPTVRDKYGRVWTYNADDKRWRSKDHRFGAVWQTLSYHAPLTEVFEDGTQ